MSKKTNTYKHIKEYKSDLQQIINTLYKYKFIQCILHYSKRYSLIVTCLNVDLNLGIFLLNCSKSYGVSQDIFTLLALDVEVVIKWEVKIHGSGSNAHQKTAS